MIAASFEKLSALTYAVAVIASAEALGTLGDADWQEKLNGVLPSVPEVKPLVPVRFYIYPTALFSAWSSCMHSLKGFSIKHDHFDYAMSAMVRHPWRTHDPSQAVVAFVPVPFDAFSRQPGGTCGGKADAHIANMTAVVQKSGLLSRLRHLVILNDFRSQQFLESVRNVFNGSGIVAHWEQQVTDCSYKLLPINQSCNCQFGLGYSSRTSAWNSLRSPEYKLGLLAAPSRLAVERQYSVHMVGQVDLKYSDRLAIMRSTGSLPGAFVACRYRHGARLGLRNCSGPTDRDRCIVPEGVPEYESLEAMLRSNYTLVLRGDTLGSNRWIDAMAAGTALISVCDSISDLHWLPFASMVPWSDFVIRIPRKLYLEDPVAAIRRVIDEVPPALLQRLQDLSRFYVRAVDWMAYSPTVLEHMMIESASVKCPGLPSTQSYSIDAHNSIPKLR